MSDDFKSEQRNYLEGMTAGVQLSQSLRVLPTWTATLGVSARSAPTDADGGGDPHRAAQDRYIAEGKKLTPEDQAKRKLNGLDTWNLVLEHARDGRFPKGTDAFLMKFQGLFYVAPAQDAFMCRLRLPGGIINSHQLRGVAELAERFAGGFADVTTRANLQLRQIGPRATIDVLMGLHDLGIVNRGAGADNIRNITASPTAGIDPRELIDTRPLARRMHHYILNHREMYGLPRKFNIAFDGGGAISALQDTNDIGFSAVRLGGGIWFHLSLGGITGHRDFARDTGVLVKPDQCVAVAAAIVRAFNELGDRTDRKKARLKYVLDGIGLAAFLNSAEKYLPKGVTFHRHPISGCEGRPPINKHGHIGFHPQKQAGLHYAGVVIPVGRMTVAQMRGLARISDRYGSGDIRLTVWQNLLVSDIPQADIPAVKSDLESLGLHWSATSIRGGLVACTGSAGCKYASADTKRHALMLADALEARLTVDQPINIHLTGCPHSCAQHFIGDIGMLATKIAAGEDMIEGYHIYVGGGYGTDGAIGREACRDVSAADLPSRVEGMLRAYLEHRQSAAESFNDFVRRHPIDHLKLLFDGKRVKT